jgi:cytochrome oxidase Cu insertion factor (SCO1/SenC/PrrC family)
MRTSCWIILWWWRRPSRITSPRVSYHVPAPGDAVPDFKLRNQDGRPIHLGQFQGKALLVTFIYTRCPSPNFARA